MLRYLANVGSRSPRRVSSFVATAIFGCSCLVTRWATSSFVETAVAGCSCSRFVGAERRCWKTMTWVSSFVVTGPVAGSLCPSRYPSSRWRSRCSPAVSVGSRSSLVAGRSLVVDLVIAEHLHLSPCDFVESLSPR